ncbi:MAG: hypothetical protein A3J74_03545 [Elusimicrobia bacterium RIFCSPHIGHO2_02_FULL_57_9]|nr:MAG: hypothetical protein A3J74_03545 [Elusimicrobia bacterium RIFCSPHIGHO2_02_FULL_57_9]
MIPSRWLRWAANYFLMLSSIRPLPKYGRGTSRSLTALFLLALISPFWSLSTPLIEVDDARYAEVPREMLVFNDWGTPHLDGFPYVEKPPLWYWLAASSYRIFGVNEAAARLPLALLSLLGMLGLAWLGSWLYAPDTGRMGAIMLASASLYFFLSHYITPDMPLAVFLLWCSALILRALMRPEDGRWAAPAAWACAGLAFLSKGLVALTFPIAWTVLLIILFPQWRRGARAFLNPLGPLLFILIAAPWFALMERRHPGFLRFIFVEQHFQRYLTQKYNRSSPWYFFILVLPAGLLPWTPAALAGFFRSFKAPRDPRDTALALWVMLVAGFFTTSQSKLATYILPAIPHLTLLAARALEEELPKWSRVFCWMLGAVLLMAPLALVLRPELAGEFNRQTLALASLALVFMSVSSSGLGEKGRGWVIAAAAALAGGSSALAALRGSAQITSVKSLSQTIRERYRPGDQIYAYGTYLHGIPFYTGVLVDRILNWTGELHYAKRDPAYAGRFGGDNEIRELPIKGRRTFVICRRFETKYLLNLSPGPVTTRPFGHWELLEF